MFALRIVIAVTTLAFHLVAASKEPMGTKPSYIWGDISSVPNKQAIKNTMWAPGLEEGYVPQGLTFHKGSVLVASYKSIDPKIGKGPCRIYSVSSTSGAINSYFDMPEDCTHAGGLTMIDDIHLVLSDTRVLYKINLKQAFAEKTAAKAIVSRVELKGGLKGSFVDFDGKDLWVGSSEKEIDKARAHKLSTDIFLKPSSDSIGENKATHVIPIPTEANGLAFDAKGQVWLTASNSKYGALYKLNAKTGEVLQKFEMVIGIEDLGFDENGMLWSVSEAGTRRWSKWAYTFPVIFRIEVEKLK